MPRSFLYPLPSYLDGRLTVKLYNRWLDAKALWLFKRDKEHRKPYVAKSSKALYKSLIHLAVVNSDGRDPYTGDKLSWELISTWPGSKKTPAEQERGETFDRKYALLPTIDHKDPDVLDFEIVSWRINLCKNYMTPEEFIALCRKVIRHRSKNPSACYGQYIRQT
jgi:hypothetical protein